jgi:hypothetical protein
VAVNPIELAVRTHQGLVRAGNQDAFMIDADLGVVVLADGMGGHRSGEVASRIAVEAALADLLPAQREAGGDDGAASLLRVGHSVEVPGASRAEWNGYHRGRGNLSRRPDLSRARR